MGLKYLPGLKWIGSLSLQDADLLAKYGHQSNSILEFGVGGSTLIFGQTRRNVMSVDTHTGWIDIVGRCVNAAGCHTSITFRHLPDLYDNPPPFDTFDFVFVDGVTDRRLTFANQAWKWLKIGGTLAFHDASKIRHLEFITKFMLNNIKTIDEGAICPPASDGKQTNMALFKKRCESHPTDGNIVHWMDNEITAGRPEWSFGSDEKCNMLWEYKPSEWE